MPHLVFLLGPFQATLDGRPIAGFRANKVRALLAYLAKNEGIDPLVDAIQKIQTTNVQRE